MPPKNSPAATSPDSDITTSAPIESGEATENADGDDASAEPRRIPRSGKGSRVRPSRSTPATPGPDDVAQPASSPQHPDVTSAPKRRDTQPEPAQEDVDATVGARRLEVPVPSVVRARERGRVAAQNPVILRTEMLTKTYGSVVAADEVSVDVHEGSFTGIVGPNGAGKTTMLSMISGLLRPTSGRVTVRDVNVWSDGPAAKRLIGTLPDRLRLFDRLTGAQLLYYSGVLHGVKEALVAQRVSELAEAFSLESALGRLVSDYSAGMQKKIALACSMIHAPEVLVLDEPFEAIDPVSASNVTEILEKFVAGGGSVIMSSHSLDLIQRVCDHVAVISDGRVIAQGTVDAVRDGLSLEERFKHLTGADEAGKGLEWLHGSADSD